MTWASLAGVTLYVGEGGLAHVYPIEHDSSLVTSLDHHSLLRVLYLEDMRFPTFSVISASG